MNTLWRWFLDHFVCRLLGHRWLYSAYLFLQSRRGCSRCHRKQTASYGSSPSTFSLEFRKKVVAIEEGALQDLREFTGDMDAGVPLDKAFEWIERNDLADWGPLASENRKQQEFIE